MQQWRAWAAASVLITGCAATEPEPNPPRGLPGPQSDFECMTAVRAGRVYKPPGQSNAATYFTTPPVTIPIAQAGRRIAGDMAVRPDERTTEAMMHEGVRRVTTALKVCIGPDGEPRSTEILASSCYPRYDAQIVAKVTAWRYAPPRAADGTPISVCTAATFIYQLN